MAILVTGAAGFIGSHLCGALLEKGNDVVGLDDFHSYYPRPLKEANLHPLLTHKNFRFIESSVLDSEALKRIKDIDVVYHYAAIAGVRYSIQHPLPYFRINSLGTAAMLDAFRNVKKFVYASSSSVYGNVPPAELPAREERPLRPLAPYSLSKMHAEELCSLYQKMYGTPVAILRFYTVYGARQRPDEMFTKFITKVLKSQEIEVYGDGEQTRDFTHVSDIVQGSILAQERGLGVYNLGSGRRVSVNEALGIIAQEVGETPRVSHVSPKPGDVRHTHADISRAREELGYEPRVSLEAGVKECVAWCRQAARAGLL